jgi:beta-lactamase regulating signal transducer with metallopeptidase domain
MIIYLLKASLILVVLTFFYNWTVKRETFYATNRMLLWINMLAVVLLPVVSLPDFAFSVVQNELAATLKPLPQTITNAGFVPSVNYRQNLHNELTLWNYISFVYWIGVIILTIKLIGQLTKLLKFIIKSKSENTIEGFKIVQNELVTSPFSFFKWIVLNRHLYDSIELEHILTHESIHARQWHSIDVLVAEILKIVLWFNPVAWWNQRLVQENLEYLVDDTVLNAGFDKKAYQFSLLKTVLASDKQILTNYFNSSLLKNRIKMMNRSQSSILTISKYLFCVFALWVSAAFAKPYQQKMVEKIVKKAPVLKTLLEPRLNEITIPAIN